jgi:hypothetical protein
MSKKNIPSTHRSQYPIPKGNLLAIGKKENKGNYPEEKSNQEGKKMEVMSSTIIVVSDGKIINAIKIYEVEPETPVSVWRRISSSFIKTTNITT